MNSPIYKNNAKKKSIQRYYLQKKSKLPGLGSQPYNSALKQIGSFGEDDGLIRTTLVIKGSLNLYSTRDEASLFPGISFKKDKFKAKVLQVKGKKKEEERKKKGKREREKERKQTNKQRNSSIIRNEQ